MKTFVTLALAGVTVLAGTSSAAAFMLAPPAVTFSGVGPVSFRLPTGGAYECKLTIRGKVNKTGIGHINTAVFTPGAAACANTASGALPWKVVAKTATTARIFGVSIFTPFGTCGPASVPVAISGSGVWTINAAVPPACMNVTASVNTAPAIIIVP